jgi:hypothetical protein
MKHNTRIIIPCMPANKVGILEMCLPFLARGMGAGQLSEPNAHLRHIQARVAPNETADRNARKLANLQTTIAQNIIEKRPSRLVERLFVSCDMSP